MADDRMRNDDLDRNMGSAGHQGSGQKDNLGTQSPGRKQQDDLSTGQRGAGQQKGAEDMDDDFGGSQKSGAGQQGGRQSGQNR